MGDGPWLATNFGLREHRLLLENAAILEALATGECLVLNRIAAAEDSFRPAATSSRG
jgi:hypothetical protein